MTRRTFCSSTLAALMSGCASLGLGKKRRFALNPSTIREYHLPLEEQVRAAIDAGFVGFEPWLKDVHDVHSAGTLKDIRHRAEDANLKFINGIAFGSWAHPDRAIREKGLEETKRDMAALAELACPYIAASMFGLQKPGAPHVTGDELAERYVTLVNLGKQYGVTPLLEYWGHSVTLFRLEQAVSVLRKTGRTDVGLLPDVYHTYRGGSSFATLMRVDPAWLPVFHVNDYPNLPPASLADRDRVWPGDGVAPWAEILNALDKIGAAPYLSLELFNLSYQKTTPYETLHTGIDKMTRVLGY